MTEAKRKPFDIPKAKIWEAWKQVKSNAGSAGIDGQTIEAFEANLKGNLFKLWNRMSSGSYMPPPVMGVAIPKKSGGQRVLGIPCVADRVAQTAVKLTFEPLVESAFLPDSFGYRPNKSAHQAVELTKKRCWQHDWVLEFDIKGLFDNIPRDLLLKAVRHHTSTNWVVLYITRWLDAPMAMPDGTVKPRFMGTPQGGVISPVLSNLFLHYAFDVWITTKHGTLPWCRYADDGLVHCKTFDEANMLLKDLHERFKECGLELHPGKTKIVYCKDSNRTKQWENTCFDFLGFSFRARSAANQSGIAFSSFQPAVSRSSLKAIKQTIRGWKIHAKTSESLQDLAKVLNPVIRGWFQYYGRFYRTALQLLAKHLDDRLAKWARRKFKSFKNRRNAVNNWLRGICKENPKLFAHWQYFRV